MKLSLFTVTFAGFWGQARLTLEESIDAAAELGFEGVEMMAKRPHLSPLDYSLDDCRRLKDRLDEKGLALSALAGYTNFTGGMDSAEVPFGEMQVAYVAALAERAKVLGGDLVRLFASYERSDVPFMTQWQRTIDGLRECCDRAGEHGVSIGLQNHHDIGVSTRMYDELIYEVGRSNLTPFYDCWSVYLLGEDVAAEIRRMAPKMRFTTVADYVVMPRHKLHPALSNYERDRQPPAVIAAPIGLGELPYKVFFDALAAGGFDGWVSYEMCWPTRDGGQLDTLKRYCRTFVEYMQPWR